MHTRDTLGAEERAFYARRQEKTLRAHKHAFLRLNEDAKRPPGIRGAPFIDKDGCVSSIEKTHGISTLPLPFSIRLGMILYAMIKEKSCA